MEIDKINNNNNGNKRKQLEINDNNDPDNRKLTKIETNNNDNNDGNNNDNNDNNDNKTTKIPDEIVTKDGHLYYVCRYCNKVFRIKKERTVHLRKCPAKSYILTIADNYNNNNNNNHNDNNNNNDNNSEQDNNIDDIEKAKKTDAFDRLLASKTNEIYLNNGKINVKQNIVLNKKTKSKMAVKITIPRSPTTDTTTATNGNNDNTVITTDNDNKDEETIATKDNTIDNNDNMVKVLCRHCKLTFNNGIDLLRHRRELHKYPKIIMAMSEIKKLYYDIKDWTKCPICTKPLHNNYRSTYLRHLNTHANEFDYIKCRICEKKFRRFDHMKDHEKRHIIEDKRQ